MAAPAGTIGCVPHARPRRGVPATIAPVDSGALVDGVLCGTAADAAGITAGDVITTADGRPVSSPDALTAIVNACRPGTVVEVTWVSPRRSDPDVPGPARVRARGVAARIQGRPNRARRSFMAVSEAAAYPARCREYWQGAAQIGANP